MTDENNDSIVADIEPESKDCTEIDNEIGRLAHQVLQMEQSIAILRIMMEYIAIDKYDGIINISFDDAEEKRKNLKGANLESNGDKKCFIFTVEEGKNS